jgi:hypothetical protein
MLAYPFLLTYESLPNEPHGTAEVYSIDRRHAFYHTNLRIAQQVKEGQYPRNVQLSMPEVTPHTESTSIVPFRGHRRHTYGMEW